AGLGVAGFHVSRELSGKMECPMGFSQVLTAPQESLAMFVVLTGLLLTDVVRPSPSTPRASLLAAVVLGLGLTAASLIANPPPDHPPTKAHEINPPTTCRQPYHPPT